MNLVLAALRRPYTVVVVVLAVVLAALAALRDAPVDIFPELDVPVIWVVQPYPGMNPDQIDAQFVHYYEYHFLYIGGIEHVESQSQQGIGTLKLYFHPGTDISEAMAQVTAMTYRSAAFLPPGTLPPFIVRFGAGNVPAAQLVFSSDSRSEAEIQDLALNQVRPLLATLPGVSAPPPSGGKVKLVVVEADPDRLRSLGVSAEDLAAALGRANLTLPSGNLRMGPVNAMVHTDALVESPEELGRVPVRIEGSRQVLVRDVARVELGADVVTNVALLNGRRTVYMPVTKRSDASTLAVVRTVREALPRMRAVVPEDVRVEMVFDQSRFVTQALEGLVLEGALGALLTASMVLLFLRDVRSAVIVVVTIPLSVLAATLVLRSLGQTINLMTLGGLTMAVGILVDESTVAIENIHAHLGLGKPARRAVADAMAEVMVPRLLAMLCVVSVFLPAFFVEGIGRSLFPPLAIAVGAAMAASWLLSSTLVPVVAAVWLKAPAHGDENTLSLLYGRFVQRIVRRPVTALVPYALVVLPVGLLAAALPVRLFPETDSGELAVRIRAADGTRLERTVEVVRAVEETLREVAGADHVGLVLSNIGPPPWNVPVNVQYNANTGPHDAVMLAQLTGDDRPPVRDVQEALRPRLAERLPGVEIAFEDADIVSRILNFGAAAEIEVVVSAGTPGEAAATAQAVRTRLAESPELRDVQIQAALLYPTVEVALDRRRLAESGTDAARVGRGLLAGTSSTVLTTPLFWVDPVKNTPYRVAVRLPDHEMASIEDLLGLDVGDGLRLADVGAVRHGTRPGVLSRYNGRKTVSVLARSTTGDLGEAGEAVDRALAGLGALPRGVELSVRGQVQQMRTSLASLVGGLGATIVVVLLLLTASFQSARSALAVMSVVPSVLLGATVVLWISGSGWNIQSLMGTVTAIGVSVANAVLLANVVVELQRSGVPPLEAVIEGGRRRVRPIVMTGAAMMMGMLPTALALAEGGDQSAPLGRAVFGGLGGSLVGTLVFLPAVLALLRGRGAVPFDLTPGEETASGDREPS
ncbi:MAG: efflux RND transporter permease subunit [Candidatus Binatia bacterium]